MVNSSSEWRSKLSRQCVETGSLGEFAALQRKIPSVTSADAAENPVLQRVQQCKPVQ